MEERVHINKNIVILTINIFSRLLVAPPPSRASRITIDQPVLPPVEEVRTPTPAKTPADQRQAIIRDFLRRAKHGLDKGRYYIIT